VVKRAALRDDSASPDAPPREYVVKCFNLYDTSKRRMLRDELQLLLAMDSCSVVGFHGAFLDAQRKVCVVLEFMDRGSLEDLWAFTRKYVVPEAIVARAIRGSAAQSTQHFFK
jgi:serine/threonine protein kinase